MYSMRGQRPTARLASGKGKALQAEETACGKPGSNCEPEKDREKVSVATALPGVQEGLRSHHAWPRNGGAWRSSALVSAGS